MVTDTAVRATAFACAGLAVSAGEDAGFDSPPNVAKSNPAPSKITAAMTSGVLVFASIAAAPTELSLAVSTEVTTGCEGVDTVSGAATAGRLMDGAGDGAVSIGTTAGCSTEGAATVAAIPWSMGAGSGSAGVNPATVAFPPPEVTIATANSLADGWATVGASA